MLASSASSCRRTPCGDQKVETEPFLVHNVSLECCFGSLKPSQREGECEPFAKCALCPTFGSCDRFLAPVWNDVVGGGGSVRDSVCDPISKMYSLFNRVAYNSVIVHSFLPFALAEFCLIFTGSLPMMIPGS